MLHTGDVGRISASEHLFVTDRKSSLILRGGSNVYPAEVERAILAIDGVVDACVVGVPDVRLGERVAAAIQLAADHALDADDIRRALHGVVAPYKVPERIQFVDSFPRNAMNKIIRGEVRALFDAAATTTDP
jgi:acyl-CoA synthetase (AMP-forming)/AMP-acid ligase II